MLGSEQVSMTNVTDTGRLSEKGCSTVALMNHEPLGITQCSRWTELERFRRDWEEILCANRNLGIFCTPEWLGSWWHAYGRGRSLLALIFTDQLGQTVGIVPLYLQREPFAGILKAKFLRLVGDGSEDSDDLDFIVRPGFERAVASSFLDWTEKKAWHICELNCLSPRSEAAAHLIQQLRVRGWSSFRRDRSFVTVELPDNWESFLKQLSSKERGKVGNRLRRLEARHQLCFRRSETIAELPKLLDTLFTLHQKRWGSRGEPGSFSLPERLQFYREMCPLLAARNWLELWVMEMDGVPVAAQIGLRYGDSVSSLQEGFDTDYSSDSVGYVLRSHVIRFCIASGARKYEFLAGDQESKQRWGAEVGNYTDIRFAHPGAPGFTVLHASEWARSCKAWLRQRLPSGVWKALQRTKATLGSI